VNKYSLLRDGITFDWRHHVNQRCSPCHWYNIETCPRQSPHPVGPGLSHHIVTHCCSACLALSELPLAHPAQSCPYVDVHGSFK
jgi:hypothetical protein